MGNRASGRRVTVKFITSIMKDKNATIEQKMEAASIWIEMEKLRTRKPKKTKKERLKRSSLLG